MQVVLPLYSDSELLTLASLSDEQWQWDKIQTQNPSFSLVSSRGVDQVFSLDFCSLYRTREELRQAMIPRPQSNEASIYDPIFDSEHEPTTPSKS